MSHGAKPVAVLFGFAVLLMAGIASACPYGQSASLDTQQSASGGATATGATGAQTPAGTRG